VFLNRLISLGFVATLIAGCAASRTTNRGVDQALYNKLRTEQLVTCERLVGGDRGGIEGDPIPLDTPDPKYKDYFKQIRERVKSKWIYPYEALGPPRRLEPSL
jgi:hypothetical protein